MYSMEKLDAAVSTLKVVAASGLFCPLLKAGGVAPAATVKYSQSMAAEADQEISKASAYTPSGYMRQRHPHLFSDSSVESESCVTREVLSYHLETLTSQKQETAFEVFAHRMCEKFVAQTSVRKRDRLVVATARQMLRPTR